MYDYVVVTYNGKQYCVCLGIRRSEEEFLYVIDYEDLNKYCAGHDWNKINDYIGYKLKNNLVEYLHNVVMDKKIGGGKGQRMTVDHISRVTTDNRKVNLRFISQTEQNENQKDRERGRNLPKGCGIKKKDLPKCVYYTGPQSGHSEMFCFDTKRYGIRFRLKSTSSMRYTLMDKLIEIKIKVLIAIAENSEFFESKNILQNYTEEQIELMKEYNNILSLSKYDCVNENLLRIPKIKFLEVDLSKASPQMIQRLIKTKLLIVVTDNTKKKTAGSKTAKKKRTTNKTKSIKKKTATSKTPKKKQSIKKTKSIKKKIVGSKTAKNERTINKTKSTRTKRTVKKINHTKKKMVGSKTIKRSIPKTIKKSRPNYPLKKNYKSLL